ncbi:activator of s-phase kinase-related [Anaeramoeba flamelloides]|uniref:Activator of s-phase kinase-related n=1 Tax=Anaeramoeba flamelloides TaxID=1746091 RepID=A0ABQ8X9V2_9EUKA|nr:activator of s-phase kinase-related [Anaeramoeba flamelloides]
MNNSFLGKRFYFDLADINLTQKLKTEFKKHGAITSTCLNHEVTFLITDQNHNFNTTLPTIFSQFTSSSTTSSSSIFSLSQSSQQMCFPFKFSQDPHREIIHKAYELGIKIINVSNVKKWLKKMNERVVKACPKNKQKNNINQSCNENNNIHKFFNLFQEPKKKQQEKKRNKKEQTFPRKRMFSSQPLKSERNKFQLIEDLQQKESLIEIMKEFERLNKNLKKKLKAEKPKTFSLTQNSSSIQFKENLNFHFKKKLKTNEMKNCNQNSFLKSQHFDCLLENKKETNQSQKEVTKNKNRLFERKENGNFNVKEEGIQKGRGRSVINTHKDKKQNEKANVTGTIKPNKTAASKKKKKKNKKKQKKTKTFQFFFLIKIIYLL